MNVLQGNAGRDSFRELVKTFRKERPIDKTISAEFAKVLEAERDLRARFDDLCDRFQRTKLNIPTEDAIDRNRLIGELRLLLARTCVRMLNPDLVILDEFQRFKHLMDTDSEAGLLAKELFDYADDHSRARVLMLSATPYKMYTVSSESGDEDHYQDFVRTIRFLLQEPAKVANFEKILNEFRRETLRSAGKMTGRISELKSELEQHLKQVMVRTERLTASSDRNGMLEEKPSSASLKIQDLRAYRIMQSVARTTGQPDVIEYWKSAPYLLNFMDDYQFKKKFEAALEDPTQASALYGALQAPGSALLSRDTIDRYQPLEAANPRLRALLSETVESGAWKLLWIAPSHPYYRPEGPYSDPAAQNFTKRLIFSSWKVVPKTISALVSYEAERLAEITFDPEQKDRTTAGNTRQRALLLRFGRDPDGRLTGMPNLVLMYPSQFFGIRCDPLAVAATLLGATGRPTLAEIRKTVATTIAEALNTLPQRDSSGGLPDETWYWAAPILLDAAFDPNGTKEWFLQPTLASIWAGQEEGDEGTVWIEHVKYARDLLNAPVGLGPRPADLVEVLTDMAIGSPGTATLRAFSRLANSAGTIGLDVRNRAAAIGWAFRNLFNRPHATVLLRGLGTREPYWRRVLEYCCDGGVQAVLDEYTHVLRESLGLLDAEAPKVVAEIANAMTVALGLRPSNLQVDYYEPDAAEKRIRHSTGTISARFALQLGETSDELGQDAGRPEKVRAAFNSPFWPFVLSSTSIGQEGLDFHTYCHAIVHWNLPTNPVDMEQREGRIHRYKGHAIRKNIATKHGGLLPSHDLDPWEKMFSAAHAARADGSSDLVPYWIYPLEGGARIERHVPVLPLSRDSTRLEATRKTLALYRMVFGQPRQEDMTRYLLQQNSDLSVPELEELAAAMRIDLTPGR